MKRRNENNEAKPREFHRNSAAYNVHPYHTKVPPEAILPLLKHYTRPGDVILDPFAGTGMTGVAIDLLTLQR